jgi:hypothetical protein
MQNSKLNRRGIENHNQTGIKKQFSFLYSNKISSQN